MIYANMRFMKYPTCLSDCKGPFYSTDCLEIFKYLISNTSTNGFRVVVMRKTNNSEQIP